MQQRFSQIDHDFFKNYFDIKEQPGSVEKKYFSKVEKYFKYISWIPGLQMILIGNSLSMNAGKESSDIDLYVVTQKNRLWLVRIMMTFIFQVLGVRKTTKKHAGRFCLSFFSTEEGMDFSEFSLDKYDIYLYFWLVYGKPIVSFNNSYEKFLEKNIGWADISAFQGIIQSNKTYIKFSGKKKERDSRFLTMVNSIFKKLFLPKTLKSYKKLGKPFGVIITDDLLKFHDNDIRKQVKDDFLKQKKI